MSDADHLKPCPYCACAAELSECERDDNDRAPRPHRVYSITCSGCEARTEAISIDWWSGGQAPTPTERDEAAKAEVIAAWNRRVEPFPNAATKGGSAMMTASVLSRTTTSTIAEPAGNGAMAHWSNCDDEKGGSDGRSQPTR